MVMDVPVTSRGIKVPIDPDINKEYIIDYYEGQYERLEVNACYEYLDENDDVIELGAGTGYVSAHISNILGESSKQISLEANPRFIQIIKKVKDINGCNFILLNKAYTSDGSIIDFYPHERPISGATTPQEQRKYGEPKEVEGINIKNIQRQFDVDDFALVSDIEGAEHGFIRNELNVLEENCRLLIIELHPETSPKDMTVENAKKKLEASCFELVDKPASDRGFYIYENTSL